MSKTIAIYGINSPPRISFNPENGTFKRLIESIGIAWRESIASSSMRDLPQIDEQFTYALEAESLFTEEDEAHLYETTVLFPDDDSELASPSAIAAFREQLATFDYDVAEVEEEHLQFGKHLRW